MGKNTYITKHFSCCVIISSRQNGQCCPTAAGLICNRISGTLPQVAIWRIRDSRDPLTHITHTYVQGSSLCIPPEIDTHRSLLFGNSARCWWNIHVHITFHAAKRRAYASNQVSLYPLDTKKQYLQGLSWLSLVTLKSGEPAFRIGFHGPAMRPRGGAQCFKR